MPFIKGSAPKSADTDPNFKDVSLLVQPEAHSSEDEVSYNVFNDASSNKCLVLPHGSNANISDTRPIGTGFSPYEKNGYYSVEFGEATPYIRIPTQTYLYPQAGDFSLECFVYLKHYGSTQGLFGFSGGGGGTAKFMFILETSGRFLIHTNGFGTQSWYSGDYRLPEKKWTFLCFRKTDGNMELFADGKSVASSSWTNVTITASVEWRIGYNGESPVAWNGFISNLRWRTGTISDGSMPSKPLTPEKGTKILSCLGNNFNDQSIELAPPYEVGYAQTFSPAVRTYNPFNINSRLFSPDGYHSIKFDGDSYVKVASSTDFEFPSGTAFSVEAWIYPNGIGGTNDTIFFVANTNGLSFVYLSTTTFGIKLVNGTTVASGRIPYIHRWNHIKYTRDTSNNGYLYLNGALQQQVTDSNAYTTQELRIGGDSTSGNYFYGYISNLRIVKGSSSISDTLPTLPLTDVTNTKLLALQSATFKDNSSSQHTVLWDGTEPDIYTNAFNPYRSDNNALSRPDGYYSIYFDGSGDYLSADYSTDFAFGSGDFTVEAWVKTTGVNGQYGTIVGRWVNNNWDLRAYSTDKGGRVVFAVRDTSNANTIIDAGVSITDNAWHHIVAMRTGGNIYIGIDGTIVKTQAYTGTINDDGSTALTVAKNSSNDFQGNISSVRIVKGSAVYSTSGYTVSTTPFTTTSQGATASEVELLICQSYGFKDNSSNNREITVSGTPTSETDIPFSEPTATEVVTRETIKVTVASIGGGNRFIFNNESVQAKTLSHMSGVTYRFDLSDSSTASHPFKLSETLDGSHTKQDGYYSMTFDGTEGLLTSHHPDFHFSHNDYTVEFWVYPTTTGLKYLCGNAPSNGAGANTSFQIHKDGNENIVVYSDGGSIATSGVALAQNTWTHVAVVRQNGAVRIYQGGIQRQTATDDYNAYPSEYFAIGQTGAYTSSAFIGSISNFHIINGFCKYPDGTTYTPPTVPTTAHESTVLLCCQSSSLNQDNSGVNKPLEERATPTTGTTTVPFSSVPNGSIYSTDVTVSGTQGQSGAYLEYKPTASTPDLNYYCTAHSGMGGKIISGEDYTRRDANDGSMYNVGATGSHGQVTLSSAIGTGDFQISFWVYGEAFASNDYIISFRGGNENVGGAFGFGVNATGFQVMYTAGYQLNAGSIRSNKMNWNFMQLRRKGNTCYVKMNGKQSGTFTYTDNISRTLMGIGGNPATVFGEEIAGHIADVKVESVVGLDRVPTIPRTSDSNTKLLTCQFSGGARTTGMIDKAFPSRKVKFFEEEVSLSSFSPYLPEGYWSVHFSSQYFRFPATTLFDFGSGDFSIGCYVKPIKFTHTGGKTNIFCGSETGFGSLILAQDQLLVANTSNNAWQLTINLSSSIEEGKWQFVQVDRSGNTVTVYLDGSSVGSGSVSGALPTTNGFNIGTRTGQGALLGYMASFFCYKGKTRGSTSVPTNPLVKDTGMSCLLFQSRNYDDIAGNFEADNFVFANTTVRPFCLFESPYEIDEDNFPYDKDKHGGSITFDGTNDGVQIQNRNYDEFDMMNTHSFCLEYWVYTKTYPTAWTRHWEQDGNKWSFRYLGSTGIIALDPSPTPSHGSNVQDNLVTQIGQWVHYAITHDFDDNKTLRLFRNGIQVDEQTAWSQGWTSGDGYANYLQNKYFGGWGYSPDAYMSDLRFTRNEPVYTENFTPRTTPATLSSEVRNQANVKLLYNFDNAGIYDQSGRATFGIFEQNYSGDNSKTVSVSSAKSKNGLSSLHFDEGATLKTRMNQQSLSILTGEFTIEFFVYFLNNPNSANQSIVRNDASFIIQRYGNEWEVGNEPTPQIQVAQSLSTGQWYYLALTRNSSNLLRLYAGAVTGSTVSSLGTASNYTTSVSSNFYFGSYGSGGGTRSLSGYIDQLRITRANRYGTESSIDVPTDLFPRR